MSECLINRYQTQWIYMCILLIYDIDGVTYGFIYLKLEEIYG